jgi:hypothetical protein
MSCDSRFEVVTDLVDIGGMVFVLVGAPGPEPDPIRSSDEAALSCARDWAVAVDGVEPRGGTDQPRTSLHFRIYKERSTL